MRLKKQKIKKTGRTYQLMATLIDLFHVNVRLYTMSYFLHTLYITITHIDSIQH